MSTSDWHPKGFEAYVKSRYTFEDAELLAQMWNIPISEAKQAIGHKILNDIEDLLPAKIAPEPKIHEHKLDWNAKALDAFFNSEFTYDDADRLARLWGQPGAFEGKKLIGAKILNGQEKLIPFLLKSVPDPKPKGETPSNSGNKLLDGFFDSEYTFEDAELLSRLWNIDIVEAKKTIGFKVLNDAESALPDKLRRSGGGTPADSGNKLLDGFFDSEYTFEDAELLSQLWNIDIVEAKKTIGFKVLNDAESALPDKIRRNSSNDRPGQLLDVFFDSDYTFEDAETLSQLWNIDIVEAKKTIGYKVISAWEEALPAKIRRAVG